MTTEEDEKENSETYFNFDNPKRKILENELKHQGDQSISAMSEEENFVSFLR